MLDRISGKTEITTHRPDFGILLAGCEQLKCHIRVFNLLSLLH